MVVQGGTAKTPQTFISRDDGKSWQSSSFQPERITRSGAFIWSDVWDCNAVLSENGSTWSKASDLLSRFRGMRTWTASLATSATPSGYAKGAHRSLSEPAPPKVPAAKDRRTGRGCPKPPPPKGVKQAGLLSLFGSSGDAGLVGVLGSGDWDGATLGTLGSGESYGIGGLGLRGSGAREPSFGTCSGTNCLRPAGSEADKTRTRFEFFRDGRCVAGGGSSCSESFERPPHVAVLDESTGKRKVSELPKGCLPVSLTGAAGLGVLTCRELCAADKKPCRALVRRPAEPGTKGALRVLDVPAAAAYRVLTRGRVLAVARGSGRDTADFLVSEPGKPDATVARNIKIEGDVMDVRLDDKGRVIVRERRDRNQGESFVVGVDGQRHPLQ